MVSVFKQPKEVAKSIPESARVVLLGECTHGTEEFYTYRAEITKYLIDTRGFQLVIVEADWPFMWHVNEYIHRRRTHMYPKGQRFPEWMWRNRPFSGLIDWMRGNHDDKVNLFGLDCYSKDESLMELLRFLDIHNPTLATRVRFASPEEWPKLLSRLQWSGDKGESQAAPPSKLEQFSAEQNLECMIAAEEYYAKQRLEPAGSQASWNARDQHMATTLLRVKELLGNPKVVVWAHNSHVGDSTATPQGGVNFQRNETWNLGQMCRSVLDEVYIVGFYSHSGTVFASERWGGKGSVKELLPSLKHTFEHSMHDLLKETGLGGGMALVHSPFQKEAKKPEKGKSPKSEKKGDEGSPFVFKEYPLGQYRMLYSSVYVTREIDERSQRLTQTNVGEKYPDLTFTAVERSRSSKGVVRLKTDKGDWVTEYTEHHRITVHCLPVGHMHFALRKAIPAAGEGGASDGASRLAAAGDVAKHLMSHPMLQRWVGVQYHPDTELESHYGEILMGKCYDMLVFIDKTAALNPTVDTPGTSETAGPPAAVVKRLMQEYRNMMKNPSANIQAHPLETNILEWHFVITGSQYPFTDGKYHGVLNFPSNFPMAPPSIRFLTPSGRFETNTRICMSMSDYHPELWNPGWTVQALLIGLQSFFYEESNQIGGMKASSSERQRLAKASLQFNMRNEIYVQYFCGEEGARNPKKKAKDGEKKAGEGGENKEEEEVDDRPTCRFCHLPGDLVAPCACKGSSQFVHLECLQQWQKNVLLTQSTHPSYQTKIDEICNVCNTPFKFQGKSRRDQIIEYTGAELQSRVACGNMLVTSRHSSEKNQEAAAKYPKMAPDLAHWTEGVFMITRGGTREHIMAVNLARPIPCPNSMKRFQGMVDAVGNAVSSMDHFIGGPMQQDEAFAMFERRPPKEDKEKKEEEESLTKTSLFTPFRSKKVPALLQTSEWSMCKVKTFPTTGDLMFSRLADILPLVKQRFLSLGEKTDLKIFWGYASWGNTQLLAEMARRSWGLSEEWDARDGMVGFKEGKMQWNQVVDNMSIAKASEYSRQE